MKKLILIAVFFALPHGASAAVLYFEPQELVAGTGRGTFVVEVRLAATQSVNAIEVGVVIPPQFELIDINEANSVVAHFIDTPHYDASRTLTFAGIIPGGFNASLTESSVRLLALRFKVTQAGEARLAFDETKTRAFRNDGAASEEDLVLQNLALSVVPGKDNLSSERPDTTPPEPFEIAVTDRHPAYPGKRVAVFEARDYGQGIAHYGVFESARALAPDSIEHEKFVEAISPYQVRDQSGTHYVYVRAWDKAGNYRTATLGPVHPARPWLLYLVLVGALALFLIARKALIYYQHGTPPAP